jgi:hypothetical protein
MYILYISNTYTTHLIFTFKSTYSFISPFNHYFLLPYTNQIYIVKIIKNGIIKKKITKMF